MPAANHEAPEVADALNHLSRAVEQMQASYAATQRANRRLRVLLVLVLILFGVAVYQALSPLANLLSTVPQLVESLNRPPVDAETANAQRLKLLDMLAPEERASFEQFEKEQKFLSNYLAAYPDFDAGATVALFLSQMAESVQVMPDLYAEVRWMNDEMRAMNVKMDVLPAMAADVQGMNAKMAALPVLTTEVQGMNVKMSVMAEGMDSTMGRAGRMMPWSW